MLISTSQGLGHGVGVVAVGKGITLGGSKVALDIHVRIHRVLHISLHIGEDGGALAQGVAGDLAGVGPTCQLPAGSSSGQGAADAAFVLISTSQGLGHGVGVVAVGKGITLGGSKVALDIHVRIHRVLHISLHIGEDGGALAQRVAGDLAGVGPTCQLPAGSSSGQGAADAAFVLISTSQGLGHGVGVVAVGKGITLGGSKVALDIHVRIHRVLHISLHIGEDGGALAQRVAGDLAGVGPPCFCHCCSNNQGNLSTMTAMTAMTPMTAMLLCMYNKAWEHECTFQRPGVIVSLFKKGDKEDGNNYRGITLLSVVDKVYTKIINKRVTNFAEAKGLLHESQNGYRPGRGCIDHVWTFHAVTSGRMRAGLRTYALFVDVVKAFPSVWRDGLWYKLWEMGIRGKMFRVLVHLYDSLSRCALHNGESSEYFSSDLGLAEGDPLSPLLYTLFINGLLKEIWEKHPGVPLPKEVDNSGSGEQGIGRADSNIEGRSKLVALMLADDLVGLAESQEQLQKMADTIHAYSRKWRFKLSPTKSAVVVFGPLPPNKESPKVSFSSENLPVLDAYTYLGIVFTSDCKWEAHIAGMIEKATASINALQTFFQNRHVSFEVKRAMLLALIRPRVEYGSEVWWASSQQTNTIESKIQIEVLKRSLHCKPNICHEVLRAEAGVRPLSSWLDQRKVEWWFKLQQKDTTSLSRQALEASWPSHRNYTSWKKRFNKLMAELGMQEETLQARVREGHLPSFRAYVRWSIYERDRAVREEGARNKSTLAAYMQHYNDDINYFKPQPYLCTGPLSKGMELIMQLRAGILPLNAMTAKFGRQSASRQNARRECCKSCDIGPELGGEVESPEHFLFDCPVYQAQRQKLWEKLTSDPDVAAKCQILESKSDEEKLHSMLNEEFWGVDVDEESGLVYGPFKHAFKCIAKYVSAAWKIRNAYAHPSDVA